MLFWGLLGGAVLLYTFRQERAAGSADVTQSDKAHPVSRTGIPGVPGARLAQDTDAEDLARVILAETGLMGPREEWIAVGTVAANRARKWGASIRDVIYNQVKPPRYPKARSAWNVGATWSKSLDNASSRKGWPQAVEIGRCILDGRCPSVIGPDRILFVHTETQLRKGRKLPSWIISKNEPGGQAPTEPIRVGRATFAGLGGVAMSALDEQAIKAAQQVNARSAAKYNWAVRDFVRYPAGVKDRQLVLDTFNVQRQYKLVQDGQIGKQMLAFFWEQINGNTNVGQAVLQRLSLPGNAAMAQAIMEVVKDGPASSYYQRIVKEKKKPSGGEKGVVGRRAGPTVATAARRARDQKDEPADSTAAAPKSPALITPPVKSIAATFGWAAVLVGGLWLAREPK